MSDERRMPRDDEFKMPSLRLDGRVALVSGGSRGLGLGMALALAHAGADIALAARTVEQLEAGAKLVEATGQRALILPTDVSEVAGVREMVRKTVEHFGRLDILVNGAGVNIRQPADTFSEDDWDRLMAINLKSVFFACQEAARIMRQPGQGQDNQFGIADLRGSRTQCRPLCRKQRRHAPTNPLVGRRMGRRQHLRQRDRAGAFLDGNDRRRLLGPGAV